MNENVDLDSNINNKTIVPLIKYLNHHSEVIHPINFYEKLSRRWPIFQRVCNELKEINQRKKDVEGMMYIILILVKKLNQKLHKSQLLMICIENLILL